MIEALASEGYDQTKAKLGDLQTRLAEIEKRTDLNPDHMASVQRSYKMMMRQYLKEIKLHEASLGKKKTLESA